MSLDEVVSALAALEQRFRDRRDRRAVFLTVYLIVTREMQRRVEAGRFLDNDWVARYTAAFANYYQKALRDFEAGSGAPKSWRIAFETSRGGAALVMQDLLLGINAHINHDLALALHEVSIDPGREQRHRDHDAVNEVLQAVTAAAEARIAQMYAPGLAAVSELAGTLDEMIAQFSLELARESAWEAAVALTNARSELERAIVRKCLDARSAVLARLLLAPNVDAALVRVLRAIERDSSWWNWISCEAIGQAAVAQ